MIRRIAMPACVALSLWAWLTPTAQAQETHRTFERFSVRPYVAIGHGFEQRKIGVGVDTSNGDRTDVNISAGGGSGGGVRLRLGVYRRVAIETLFGVQESTENPGVTNADAEFSRSVLLLNAVMGTRITRRSRLYGGIGAGLYQGARLDISGFDDVRIDYGDATGYQFVLGWENIPRQRAYGGVALRAYSVEYRADRLMQRGTAVNDIRVDGESLSTINGSGVDLTLFFGF